MGSGWRISFSLSPGHDRVLLPFCLALAVAAPSGSYAQVPAVGLWTGFDSQGVPMSFVVTSGGSQVNFSSFGASCSNLASQTSPVAVSAGQFEIRYLWGSPHYCLLTGSLTGAFGSATTASGTSESSSGGITCPFCSNRRTWTASYNGAIGVADLAVTKTDEREVASPGAETTYVIKVTNNGPDSVGALHLSDAPPFLEPWPAWSVSGGTYEPSTGLWVGAPLFAGAILTFRVMGHFSPSVGGLATNTAFVSTTEAFDPGHYKLASDLTLVRTLAVTLSGSTVAATPPTTIVLTTTLANQGTVAAENVEVSFSTPPGLTFSGNTGACTTPFPCALGTMPPSSERRVTTTVELPQGYPGPDSLAFVVAATTMTAAATAPENTDQWFVRVLRPRPATFHLVEPCRLLDTRSSTPIAAGATRTVVATGSCRVPASARSLALNVTVDAPTGDGHLRLFPGITLDGSTASEINFRAGQTRANNAVVGLGGAGDVSILAEITGGWVHVILDVNGYFE